MSITVGIKICKKDSRKAIGTSSVVSWKNWNVNMWIDEWLYNHQSPGKLEFVEFGDDSFYRSIRKDDLLRMADDIINRRFDICPDAYEYFAGDDIEEEKLSVYGVYFRKLAEKVQDDEMLVYYDCGN